MKGNTRMEKNKVREHTLYTNGNKFKGEWKDGKPWNLAIDIKNGIIIGN